jgi:hypothetical protein
MRIMATRAVQPEREVVESGVLEVFNRFAELGVDAKRVLRKISETNIENIGLEDWASPMPQPKGAVGLHAGTSPRGEALRPKRKKPSRRPPQ